LNQKLPNLELPESLNYIGAFVTMGCNLACKYCINDPEQAAHRDELFPIQSTTVHVGLTPEEWVLGLSRIPSRQDLPVTTNHYFDMLTNLVSFKPFKNFNFDDIKKFQRDAPYPSIRVSWHEDEMNRIWRNKGFERLVIHCLGLQARGWNVYPDPKDSDVGIYMVAHPSNELPNEKLWKGIIPFETKDFLGIHEGKLYGNYAYPYSTNLVKMDHWPHPLSCKCLTNELLIDPMGIIWPCHLYFYETWARGGLRKEFLELQKQQYQFVDNQHIFKHLKMKPIGHILDPKLELKSLGEQRVCYHYGECVGCDVKSKRAHYTGEQGYSSVKITDIAWPEELKRKLNV